jgi:hypothetical protein
VHELVRLLRITGAPVFLDTDSVAPGELWAEKVGTAIQAAEVVAVFWSHNAAQSREMAKELLLALSLKKTIVPVLIEDGPLPDDLAAYQGVMLGDLFAPHDVTFDPMPYVRRLVERFAAPATNGRAR